MINNAETLAQLALIARHGPRWFRALGTSADPGSALVTLSGAVAHPGVYEIEHGAPLPALIEAAGGSTSALRAVLLGGYGGAWVAAGAIPELALANEQLAARGASLGAGVVVLLSERACPVAEVARVTRWLAAQSAGQCGPCVHGLDAIAGAIEEVAHGAATAGVGQAHRPLVHARERARGMPSPGRRRALHHQWPGGVRGGVRRPREIRSLRGVRERARTAPADPTASSWQRPRESMSIMRLKVDPIACEAHGMCAELLPERIALDDWGYPILDERPLPPELTALAKRAAEACPTFALLLIRDEQRD